jgi:eukaryotic-like serine/threonine-protein kinase
MIRLSTNSYASVDDSADIDEQDERLVNILDQYLIDLEAGKRPNASEIIASHPDLAEALRESCGALRLLSSLEADLPGNGHESLAAIPKVLDDFVLGRELGRGAAGIVYEAQQVSLDRAVAVKVLAFCSSIQHDRVERFYREATAAALLNHPHIVSVLGVGCCQGTHYYAMNRVEGASLDQRIEAAVRHADEPLASPLVGPDRFRRIARFMADAADALAHAHQEGIVHRDIKPSNLLLTPDDHLWVADFGLARIGGEANLTRSGDMVGTIRYMSPEQASGKSEWVDGRTDIYALGATLYELVLLKPTFEGHDSAQLLRAIQTTEPATPRSIDRSIPVPLETIIRRAMRRSASERYQSASEMAADLRRFAAGQPIQASKVTLAERWSAYLRDHAAMVAAAMLLAIVSIAASTAHSVIVADKQSQTERALGLSQKNYLEARRAVDTLGADVAMRLATIPQAAELQQEVLAETLAYYEKFIADSNDDPSLGVEVAKTRLKIAQLVRFGGGSFADSDAAYAASIQALRSLTSNTSSEINSLRVQALNEWAMLRCEHGELKGVDELLNEAAVAANGIETGNASKVAIALVHNNRGVIALRQNNKALAMKEMQSAVEIFQSISDLSQLDQDMVTPLVSDLAAALANLATLMSEAGQAEQALTLMASSIDLNEQIQSDRTEDALGGTASELRRRALSHNNLAAMRWRAGQTEKAIESYGRAVQWLEHASAKLPGLIVIRRELAVALNNQGMAFSSAERFDEAENAFRRALAIAQPTAEADPSDVVAARECGGILNNLGVLLRNRGRIEDAKVAFSQAIQHQMRARKLSPLDPENGRFLDQIRHNFVSVEG